MVARRWLTGCRGSSGPLSVREVDLLNGGPHQPAAEADCNRGRSEATQVASFRVAGTIAAMNRFLVLLAAAVLLAACSSDEATPTIPDSGDVVTTTAAVSATSTSVAPADERLTLEQAALEFTECMRAEDIDFPDIRIDAEGRPQLGDVLDRVDTASPEFRAALASCSPILTRSGALELSSDPELQAVLIDQLAAFSECMRTNGVEQFPDPIPGFNGTGSPYLLGEIPFDDPDFQTATEACQASLGDIGLQD